MFVWQPVSSRCFNLSGSAKKTFNRRWRRQSTIKLIEYCFNIFIFWERSDVRVIIIEIRNTLELDFIFVSYDFITLFFKFKKIVKWIWCLCLNVITRDWCTMLLLETDAHLPEVTVSSVLLQLDEAAMFITSCINSLLLSSRFPSGRHRNLNFGCETEATTNQLAPSLISIFLIFLNRFLRSVKRDIASGVAYISPLVLRASSFLLTVSSVGSTIPK